MKRKTTKIQARVMWGYQSQLKIGQAHIANSRIFPEMNTPLFILPATAEAYDAMVEQMAKVAWEFDGQYPGGPDMGSERQAIAMLASIGITRPTS